MSTILRVKVQGLGRTFGLIEYSHLTSVIAQCLPTVLFGEGKKIPTFFASLCHPEKRLCPLCLSCRRMLFDFCVTVINVRNCRYGV